MQNQCTKMCCIHLYSQWTNPKSNQENKPIYISKIIMGKFNQGGEILYTERYIILVKKLKIQINWKTAHVHELEE